MTFLKFWANKTTQIHRDVGRRQILVGHKVHLNTANLACSYVPDSLEFETLKDTWMKFIWNWNFSIVLNVINHLHAPNLWKITFQLYMKEKKNSFVTPAMSLFLRKPVWLDIWMVRLIRKLNSNVLFVPLFLLEKTT